LLAWAGGAGALVLEEDCEGELRYGDMNVPSLTSLDTAERVILLGGFCTSLGPWVGLAYLVLPRRLMAAALAARRLIDDSRDGLEETALAELLGSGGYARHLHRLGKTYARRRDVLLAALARRCGLEAAALPANTRNRMPGGRAVMLGFGSLSERQLESRVTEFVALVRADKPHSSVSRLSRGDSRKPGCRCPRLRQPQPGHAAGNQRQFAQTVFFEIKGISPLPTGAQGSLIAPVSAATV
jgi:hypothetical protein